MIPERVKACLELVLLLADVGLVATSCAFHFMRGEVQSGTVHGAITIVLFFLAGILTNTYHFFKHEWRRMAQRTTGKKVRCVLLIFVFPCFYLLEWYFRRLRNPVSLTIRCWTASLRLFYCTGTLVQSVFQSYLVVDLWWKQDVDNINYYVMIVTAVVLALHAIYGVCGYIWTNYYDEEHENMSYLNFTYIVVAISLNMGGRVTAMAVVMGTLGWLWLFLAVISPFLLNYTVYAIQAPLPSLSTPKSFCIYVFLLPLAFLSSVTMSKRRVLTLITTLAWLVCSLPQIITYHETLSNWLAWIIPAVAQIVALILMMVKWNVFEIAFQRFDRQVKMNQWTQVPVNVPQKTAKGNEGSV